MNKDERKAYMRDYLKIYAVKNRARINEHKAKYRAANRLALRATSAHVQVVSFRRTRRTYRLVSLY